MHAPLFKELCRSHSDLYAGVERRPRVLSCYVTLAYVGRLVRRTVLFSAVRDCEMRAKCDKRAAISAESHVHHLFESSRLAMDLFWQINKISSVLMSHIVEFQVLSDEYVESCVYARY